MEKRIERMSRTAEVAGPVRGATRPDDRAEPRHRSPKLAGAAWLCFLLWHPAAVLAGAWTLPQGAFWGKVAYEQQEAEEWYIASPQLAFEQGGFVEYPAGARRAYASNGVYRTRGVFLDGVLGITDRLDLGVQISYIDPTYADDAREDAPSDPGLGDSRLFGKWRLLHQPALVTLKAAVKIPTGKFRAGDGLVPSGDGQWDIDLIAQLGRSFWPLPVYGNIDIGYRVRLRNDEIRRDPGDEWLVDAELGCNVTRRVMLVGKLEMLRGKIGTESGFRIPSLERRITYLHPALVVGLHGDTVLELGARYSLDGRNYPAGHVLTLGLSTKAQVGRIFRTD